MKCDVVQLGELCRKVVSGGTPKSTVAEFYDGDIPWLNTKEVHFNRISQTERKISTLGLENSSAKWIPANCVIVAMYGATAGNVAVNLIPMTTNQACCNLEIDETRADYRFIYYYLKLKYMSLSSLANGGAQQNLNAKLIKDFPIVLPPLNTQIEIANLLWALDDKIELNNKINANLEQQAQALFKAWFVDFKPFGGKMPEDWQEIPLEKLCEVVTKGTTPTTLGKPFTEQGANFIKGESIQENHTFDLQKMSHISDETNQLLKRSIIYSDDILFTIAGTLGRFAMVDEDLLPANTNQAVCIIRSSSERVSPIFLYSFFIGNWHNEFYAKRVQQAVQQNLSLGTIKSLPILIPPSKELGVYCDLLGPILKQVKQNEIENRRLTMLRNVLLPRLMSGKVLV